MKIYELPLFYNSYIGTAICIRAEKSNRAIVRLDVKFGGGELITILPVDSRPPGPGFYCDGIVKIDSAGNVSRIDGRHGDHLVATLRIFVDDSYENDRVAGIYRITGTPTETTPILASGPSGADVR